MRVFPPQFCFLPRPTPAVIRQILKHLRSRETADSQARLPPERAPPQSGRFDEADK